MCTALSPCLCSAHPFVDSNTECNAFSVANGACAPSARKWVHWLATNYTEIGSEYNFADVYTSGTPLNDAAKQAYAEVIVGHYAERFGSRLAGYWFDQGTYSNPTAIFQGKISSLSFCCDI